MIKSLFPIENKKEELVMKKIKENVYSKYKTGKYEETEEVKEILDDTYKYLLNKVNTFVKKTSNVNFLKRLTFEYYNSFALQYSATEDQLVAFYGGDIGYAQYRSQYYRRVLKYLIEQVAKNISEGEEVAEKVCDTELITLSEELLQVSGNRGLVDMFQEKMQFEINPRELTDIFTVRIPNNFVINFPRETFLRDSTYFEKGMPIFFQTEDVKLEKDRFYKKEFSLSVSEFNDFFNGVVEISKKYNDNPIVEKEVFIEEISVKTKLEKIRVENLIERFIIKAEEIENKPYNPKRKNRLYKKFLVEFDEKLIVSIALIAEGYGFFTHSLHFNKSELIENGSCLTEIGRSVGTKFERFVEKKFNDKEYLTLQGLVNYKTAKGEKVNIEHSCGDIDVVAYNSKLKKCYLIECKMLEFSTESRHYSDDYQKFFRGRKAYVPKFKKKIDHFKKNKVDILSYLLKQKNVPINDIKFDDVKIENKLLTFYPSVLEEIVDEDSHKFTVESAYIFFNRI